MNNIVATAGTIAKSAVSNTRFLMGKVKFTAKQKSPEALLILGIGCLVGGAVLACRNSFKAKEIIDDALYEQDVLDEHVEEFGYSELTTPEYIAARKADIKKQVVWSCIKLYTIPVLLGIAGIAGCTGSHVILSKRNVALAAGYTALERSFTEYRSRVKDVLGEEAETALYTGAPIDISTVKDGKKKTIHIDERASIDQFSRVFDESSTEFSKLRSVSASALENQTSILRIQGYFNELLNKRGNVCINEVYDAFGWPRVAEGCNRGWVKKDRHDDSIFIDFGLGTNDEAHRLFMNKKERNVLLLFNVQPGLMSDNMK